MQTEKATRTAWRGSRPAFRTRFKRWASIFASGALWLLLPKCPMCLAAYIATATGIGLSLSGARYLCFALISLCMGAIFSAFVSLRRVAKN